jgi:hypothetical protein
LLQSAFEYTLHASVRRHLEVAEVGLHVLAARSFLFAVRSASRQQLRMLEGEAANVGQFALQSLASCHGENGAAANAVFMLLISEFYERTRGQEAADAAAAAAAQLAGEETSGACGAKSAYNCWADPEWKGDDISRRGGSPYHQTTWLSPF